MRQQRTAITVVRRVGRLIGTCKEKQSWPRSNGWKMRSLNAIAKTMAVAMFWSLGGSSFAQKLVATWQ
tara:strand:+ start:4784 stop:4987 length:204 start_codon:yes stop_codon:yes gene_type:complete